MPICLKGVRQNNLKNISLEIPKKEFVVVTGISGSGKSTLAFDVIYAESQREFLESMSTYSRVALPRFQHPDLDEVSGLPPAVVIDQKQISGNPRSTVGTVSEVYAYLRLLFSRFGTPSLSVWLCAEFYF